jgi:hypothetical protein
MAVENPTGGVGAYEALELSAAPKVKQRAAAETIGIRSEQGGASARLRGQIEADAEVTAGTTIATILNPALRPKATVEFPTLIGFANQALIIASTGVITSNAAIAATFRIKIDGVTFST